jgi:hypothetical protein
MKRYGNTLVLLIGASLGVAACSGSIDTGDDQPNPTDPSGSTTGSVDNTFDHDDDDTASVWQLIDRLTNQGPPSFTSRMHDCPKPTYATLGNILTSVGVNLASKGTATAPTAGDLYKSGASAMGAPNYVNRIRETVAPSTSGASREFDIFAAAAPEVIAAMPTNAHCTAGGAAAPALFNADNSCNAQAISCIIGAPAQPQHMALCQLAVTSASTPTIGQHIAVAAMLAAAYTCD